MSANSKRRAEKSNRSSDLNVQKFYSEKTIQDILDTVDSVRRSRIDHYLYIMLLVYTGARRTEVLDVRAEDIAEGHVTIKASKGSKDRSLRLPESLYADLLSYSNGKDYLFDWHPDTASRIVKRYVKPSKLLPRPIHAIRHAVGIRLYRETRDIKAVAAVLGHRNIRNTDLYVTVVDTDEAVKFLWK